MTALAASPHPVDVLVVAVTLAVVAGWGLWLHRGQLDRRRRAEWRRDHRTARHLTRSTHR